MRIAYVCADPGIPVFGTKGASVHVQEVVRVLLDAGHNVDLFCRRTDGEPWPEAAAARAGGRLRVHELDRISRSDLAARERALLAGDADMLAAITAAAGDTAFDLVYERYSLFSRAGTRYAAPRGVLAVLEVNAPLPLEQARHRGLVHTAEATAVVREAAGDADVVVCVSEPVAEWVRKHLDPARSRPHVLVEANGVDTDRIRPAPAPAAAAAAGPGPGAGAAASAAARAAAGVSAAPASPAVRGAAHPYTVGFVGTLKPWHGTATLIEAFGRLRTEVPDARLLVVGDGPDAEPLRRLADDLGLADAVTFTGAVRPTEVPGLLHEMDVACAPYPVTAGEGYFSPLKVYEYMAAGLPVVASAVGQLPQVVDDGATGLLVPGSDPASLAVVLTVLARDPGLRARLGAAARAEMVAAHTWTHVVSRTLAAAGMELIPSRVAAAETLGAGSPAELAGVGS